jgi:geranylgeranyl pyrophosphate synthase
MTAEERNYLYDLYFLTLRAGHCGQGFDIYGLEYRLKQCLETNDTDDLLRAVTATHRLKSAVPASNLAKMGAKIGKGTTEQIEAIGNYFEKIGIAFQIVDDILNIQGQDDAQGNVLKSHGEDLHEGKITYPVARAFTLFTAEQRQNFWDVLKTKPEYDIVENVLIKELNSVDALKLSHLDAKNMVEEAFERLDAAIPDSYYKLMIRAFGDYVLDRHY